ncbi:hypothetical protein FRX31_022554 [Thalictrum thalictroides]|uniref:RNase H type-1 domain-containing protein n=1 Tax=Thalictrum thalictroides TaxID=46969 RepID=A0A7J6VUG0_THATH|nr:hypothetical protein FRX31_022554 [Thalictrum thalictroides]
MVLNSEKEKQLILIQSWNTLDWFYAWTEPPIAWNMNKIIWNSLCVIFAWEVWKMRCAIIFQGSNPSIDMVVSNIRYTMRGMEQAHDLASRNRLLPSNAAIWIPLIPPRAGFVKLNVDTAFSSANVPIGIGFILRTNTGSFMIAGNSGGCAASAECAECQGLLTATTWAIQQHRDRIEIETDCQTARLQLCS